jgi:hypothetical protein
MTADSAYSGAAAAMQQGMADAQARMDWYGGRPGQGVPAGTVGSDPQPLELPQDRAVTGVPAPAPGGAAA